MVGAARDLGLVVYVTTYPEDGVGGSRNYLQEFNANMSDGLLMSLAENEDLGETDLNVRIPDGVPRLAQHARTRRSGDDG